MAINFARERQTVIFLVSASLFLLALFPPCIGASSLTLAWEANTEDDLAGYKVYYGIRSRDYDSVIDVGNFTQYTVTSLEPDIRCYFAVTAYDASGNESDFSHEVSGVAPNDPGPDDSDTDSDGMPDAWEVQYFGDLTQNPYGDYDGDWLYNVDEYQQGTDPTNPDSDYDEMPDGWEAQYGLNPLDASDANVDSDGDGSTNREEYLAGTDPTNAPPTASAGPDQTVREGATVTLDASNSSDPDDGIASYLWEQTGGIPVALDDPTAVQPTFISPDVGPDGASLTFQLTVTDNGGLQSTDTCIVNVAWENAPPMGDAGPDQTVDEGATVTLDASNSSDPDDGIASYLWEQTGGIPVALDDPTAVQPTFTAPGVKPVGASLDFRLTVIDYGGLQSTDTCIVNVTWVNVPPTADAGPDQTMDEGATVTLDASNSSDSDDGIASYLWKQKTGFPVTLSDPATANPNFVAPSVDADGMLLSFQVTLRDNGGLQASDEVSVLVNDNGISGFPDDVITIPTSTGENIGIKVDSGGNCINLEAIDPSTIADTKHMPRNMIYGLVHMYIKVDTPGGTAMVTFYLPTPAPRGHKWYRYSPLRGWKNYTRHAVFNPAMDQVTVILVDAGAGDDDGVCNGMIVDASGLGKAR